MTAPDALPAAPPDLREPADSRGTGGPRPPGHVAPRPYLCYPWHVRFRIGSTYPDPTERGRLVDVRLLSDAPTIAALFADARVVLALRDPVLANVVEQLDFFATGMALNMAELAAWDAAYGTTYTVSGAPITPK